MLYGERSCNVYYGGGTPRKDPMVRVRVRIYAMADRNRVLLRNILRWNRNDDDDNTASNLTFNGKVIK